MWNNLDSPTALKNAWNPGIPLISFESIELLKIKQIIFFKFCISSIKIISLFWKIVNVIRSIYWVNNLQTFMKHVNVKCYVKSTNSTSTFNQMCSSIANICRWTFSSINQKCWRSFLLMKATWELHVLKCSKKKSDPDEQWNQSSAQFDKYWISEKSEKANRMFLYGWQKNIKLIIPFHQTRRHIDWL